MIIVIMRFKMRNNVFDALAKKGNLDFRRTGIAFVGFKFFDDLFFIAGHSDEISEISILTLTFFVKRLGTLVDFGRLEPIVFFDFFRLH